MKKFLLALLIGTATVAVSSSCTKEYYTDPATYTQVLDVYDADWVLESDNRIFVELNVPDLSDYYVDYGVVNVSLSFDDVATYDAIPATIGAISYNYNYTTGRVTIYAEDPISGDVTIDPPSKMTVKISLTEAQ